MCSTVQGHARCYLERREAGAGELDACGVNISRGYYHHVASRQTSTCLKNARHVLIIGISHVPKMKLMINI